MTRGQKILIGSGISVVVVGVIWLTSAKSPSDFCSKPEVVQVYKKLEWPDSLEEDRKNYPIRVIGGNATVSPNVYKCFVIAGQSTDPAVFKLEVLDNGTFYVTDMSLTNW